MDELDFTLEFNSDTIGEETEAELFVEADERLRQLAAGHSDIVGAAVTIRREGHGETPHQFEATVVVYCRPEPVAGSQKEDNPAAALKEALDAVERQIRERRARLKRRWEQPGNDPVTQELIEVTAAENAAAENVEPDEEEL